MLLHGISFFLESKRKSTSDHYRQWSGEWGLTSVDPSGGGALPYLAYTGMCRWTGYGFQNRVHN